MSTPSMPRLLAGLAATALAVGLGTAPMIAYADPTQTPTPGPTASATPSATPSPTDTGAASPSPSEPDSPPPSTQTTPSDTATPSPSGTTTAARRPGSDALAAPGPAAEEPAVEEQPEVLQVEEASITLAKTASPTRVSRVGQVVRYRFVATNDGGAALTDVRITDELEGLGPIGCDRAEPVTLQPGDILTCSATLTVTQADLDFGAIFNFASVFGEVAGEEGAPPEGAVDDAAVQVTQRPSIGLTASVSPTGTADRGDRLRYRATATNTGNVTLTRARITSSLDSLDLDCDPSARATLAPGATISCSGSYRVSAADARRGRVTNELTARAERPFGDVEAGGDDVTDDIRLRIEVNEPADDGDPGLADTGGPAGAWPVGLVGLVGVAAVVAGAGLLRRGLRS